jgi:hypothetical protein
VFCLRRETCTVRSSDRHFGDRNFSCDLSSPGKLLATIALLRSDLAVSYRCWLPYNGLCLAQRLNMGTSDGPVMLLVSLSFRGWLRRGLCASARSCRRRRRTQFNQLQRASGSRCLISYVPWIAYVPLHFLVSGVDEWPFGTCTDLSQGHFTAVNVKVNSRAEAAVPQ